MIELLRKIFCRRQHQVVGAWYVDAIDAPYVPHQFVFHADGTVLTTNPTNVQEDPEALGGGTNDSVGMGVWKSVTVDGQKYVIGTFQQLNAYVDDHSPADTLSVSFKIDVGNYEFIGPAFAKLGNGGAPATLRGFRILIDHTAINDL